MIFAKYAHPNNGHEYQQVEINGLLKVKQQYPVDRISIGNCHTVVFLKSILKPFNTVFFDFYENGKEIDIYTDPRFNHHIKEYCDVREKEG